MRSSIRKRLLVGTIVTVALAFLAMAVIVTTLVRGALRDQFEETLRSKAHELANQIESHDGQLEIEVDPRTIAGNEAFEIWTDGRIVAKSRRTLGTLDLGPAQDDDTITDTVLPPGRPARQITLRTLARPEGMQALGPLPIVLAFARTTEEVDAAAHQITTVVIGAGVAGIALCIMLLLMIVHAALAPVHTLAAAIAAVRASDLAVRLAPKTDAVELVPIAERLDDLLARLGAAFTRERELTAEVAHELRTPLAGLRATIELALDRDRPAERYRGALEQSLLITRETERLVESLLSLARLDAGQAVVDAVPLDLDQLVRDVLGVLHPRVAERQLSVVTELEPVTLTSDRDKLRMIVTNLIDNATTYADEGGEIRITLDDHTLRVSNTGCTLAPADIPHVFERFWRADSARAKDGHTGIGLALVHKLIELLGGAIAVEVRDGRFIATVRLPG